MVFNPDLWRYCQHRRYQSGHRSRGANLPGYAQGAYFPGDEPGCVCDLAGCFCEEPPKDNAECPLYEEGE